MAYWVFHLAIGYGTFKVYGNLRLISQINPPCLISHGGWRCSEALCQSFWMGCLQLGCTLGSPWLSHPRIGEYMGNISGIDMDWLCIVCMSVYIIIYIIKIIYIYIIIIIYWKYIGNGIVRAFMYSHSPVFLLVTLRFDDFFPRLQPSSLRTSRFFPLQKGTNPLVFIPTSYLNPHESATFRWWHIHMI